MAFLSQPFQNAPNDNSFSCWYAKHENTLLLLFFFSLAILGFIIASDYGMTWDEIWQRTLGEINYEYVSGDNNNLLTYKDKDYGPIYEIFLYSIETSLIDGNNPHQIFIFRHFINHLFFLSGAYVLFLLIRLQYKSTTLAWVAVFTYLIMPRLYAHSFFNTKDVPFLVMSIFSLYAMTVAFKKYNRVSFLICGIVFGILTSTRIMGIQLAFFTLAALALDLSLNKDKWKHIMSISVAFISGFLISLILSWPYLWGDPFNRFILSFNNMANFRWEGKILFNGDRIYATDIPWYYSMTWISITTPPVYLLAILSGISLLLWDFIANTKNYITNSAERNTFIYFLFLISPIAAVILFDSVLYNGWRQLYFTYAGGLLLLVYFFNRMLKLKIKYKSIILGISFLLILSQWLTTAYTMFNIHPWQNLYFNVFIEKSEKNAITKNWEYDYWGTSYKAATDYLTRHYPTGNHTIYFEQKIPGVYNLMVFGGADGKRFSVSKDPGSDVDFIVTNYSGVDADSVIQMLKGRATEIYSVKAQNSQIMSIYKSFDNTSRSPTNQ